jgi:hypothetical protein
MAEIFREENGLPSFFWAHPAEKLLAFPRGLTLLREECPARIPLLFFGAKKHP